MKKQEMAKKMKSTTHDKDAHYYKYTKSGQAQSKAYDNFFSPKSKKGKGSLNKPKGEKNEGEKHYLGKDEQPVA